MATAGVKDLFSQLSAGLEDEATRKQAIAKGNAIFSFDLKSAGKYYIDLKNTGKAGEGASPGKSISTVGLIEDLLDQHEPNANICPS